MHSLNYLMLEKYHNASFRLPIKVCYQVGNSSQSLWKDLEHDKKKRYNGYVVGVTGLLSSFSSWVLTRLNTCFPYPI